MGTRSKTTSPITLWHNAPPQADSAQSVGRTFGEADSSHATRRGCWRSWRHPRREGHRWSARGWQSACHPRDIPSAATSALSPRSRSSLALAIVFPPLPQPHRPTVFPAVVPAHPPAATLHPPFPLAIPLALSWQPPPAAVSIGPVVPRQSTAVAPTSEHGPPPPSSPS